MEENEINRTNNGHDPKRLPLRSEQEEMEERLWLEMETIRQQQNHRPAPRRREDIPRLPGREDLLISPNTPPGSMPTSPAQPNNPPRLNPNPAARINANT